MIDDEVLYNNYINGDKKAFDELYKRYDNRLKFFIYGITKDYEKSEDILQDVFLYIINQKYNSGLGSFKNFLYLIAKSKSINYLKTKNNRELINEKIYEIENDKQIDLLEQIINKENKKEIIQEIKKLKPKYRMAFYLTKVEDFSYKETAKILGTRVGNVKNYVCRSRKRLYKEIKKIFVIIFLFLVITSTGYAIISRINNYKKVYNQNIIATYSTNIGETDTNSVWVGTFNLAWNELINLIGKKIAFANYESSIVDELNKQDFNKSMIDEKYYYIKVEKTSPELKNEIINELKIKFDYSCDDILNKLSFEKEENNYTIFAVLFKEFEFNKAFKELKDGYSFNDSGRVYKYFGIDANNMEELKDSVEILFYNNENDYAIRLNTKDGDEVILYLNDSNDSFEKIYNEILEQTDKTQNIEYGDLLAIPYINFETTINYGDLCGKRIEGTGYYLSNAIQSIKYDLNEKGGNLISEASIQVETYSFERYTRKIIFDKPFVLFMKENESNKPYFALKIEDESMLVEK